MNIIWDTKEDQNMTGQILVLVYWTQESEIRKLSPVVISVFL